MGHQQQYTQCILRRRLEDRSEQVDTAWIPTQFAKVGKVLKLRTVPERPDCFGGALAGMHPNENAATAWVDGWRVAETGNTRDAAWLLDHERDWKTQRQASDI